MTVTTPVYESAATLEHCMRSANRQSLRDIGMPVTNDATVDSSAAFAERLAAKDLAAEDSCVTVLRLPENGGDHRAMSGVIEAALGKWVVGPAADASFFGWRLLTSCIPGCVRRRLTGQPSPALEGSAAPHPSLRGAGLWICDHPCRTLASSLSAPPISGSCRSWRIISRAMTFISGTRWTFGCKILRRRNVTLKMDLRLVWRLHMGGRAVSGSRDDYLDGQQNMCCSATVLQRQFIRCAVRI